MQITGSNFATRSPAYNPGFSLSLCSSASFRLREAANTLVPDDVPFAPAGVEQ